MPNQVWQCKYCNKIHKNRKDAEVCEGNHFGVKEIKGYEFMISHNDKYPKIIRCVMEDGKIVDYYREQLAAR